MEWVGRHYAATLENLDDEYMSQRSVDVLDVCRRVVNILDGEPRKAPELEVPCILVGERIFPSDIISIDRAKILGFATSGGSIQSHAAIMARTMDIPAVVQLGSEMLAYSEGQAAILDAYNGDMIVKPDADAVRHAAGNRVHVNQIGSLMSIFFTGEDVTDYDSATTADTKAYADYFGFMLDHGIYVAPSQFESMFVSDAHTDADIQKTIHVMQEYFAE